MNIKTRFPLSPIATCYLCLLRSLRLDWSGGTLSSLFCCSSQSDADQNETAVTTNSSIRAFQLTKNENDMADTDKKKWLSKMWLPSLSVLSHIHQMSCSAYMTVTCSDDSVYDNSNHSVRCFGNIFFSPFTNNFNISHDKKNSKFTRAKPEIAKAFGAKTY